MDARPCPICAQPVRTDASNPDRPFCSRRCRMIDLDRWFSGDYRVPGPPAETDTVPAETDAE